MEESASFARHVVVKLVLVAAFLLLLLAVSGALVEAARGRRPALVRRPK